MRDDELNPADGAAVILAKLSAAGIKLSVYWGELRIQKGLTTAMYAAIDAVRDDLIKLIPDGNLQDEHRPFTEEAPPAPMHQPVAPPEPGELPVVVSAEASGDTTTQAHAFHDRARSPKRR